MATQYNEYTPLDGKELLTYILKTAQTQLEKSGYFEQHITYKDPKYTMNINVCMHDGDGLETHNFTVGVDVPVSKQPDLAREVAGIKTYKLKVKDGLFSEDKDE